MYTKKRATSTNSCETRFQISDSPQDLHYYPQLCVNGLTNRQRAAKSSVTVGVVRNQSMLYGLYDPGEYYVQC